MSFPDERRAAPRGPRSHTMMRTRQKQHVRDEVRSLPMLGGSDAIDAHLLASRRDARRFVAVIARVSAIAVVAAVAALATLTSSDVSAQDQPTEAPSSGDLEPEVDDDDVVGATATVTLGVASPPLRSLSDFELVPASFRAVPRRTSEQLLTLAPGLVLANHGGIGHAPSVYLRGFDAGEGQNVAFDVDGMLINEPSNPHAHGYADTSFVPVEAVSRVHVSEGPFDPRQPSYSVAGSVRYDLGVAERGLRFSMRYGSFRTARALMVYAPPGERDGTFVAADFVRGDGFGPNRAHQSARLVARIERERNDAVWSLTATTHAQRFDSAGVVPESAVAAGSLPCGPGSDAQFFCWVDPRQGGSGQRHLVLGKVRVDRGGATFEQSAGLMFRSDRFQDDFTGVARSALGDGLDQRYEAITAQLRGSYRMRGRLLGAGQTFELGYFARHDQGTTAMARVRFSDGVPREQVFDSAFGITELAAYALADLTLSRFLTLLGGLRVDATAAQVTHRGLAASDRDGPRLTSQTTDVFGAVTSPRLTLVAHPHASLDVVASAGRGVRPVDAQALSDAERVPYTRVAALELGLRHRIVAGSVTLDSRSSAFVTRVDDDLLFDADLGRNRYIGETRRYGVMCATTLRYGTRLDAQASFTWAEAHKTLAGAALADLGSGPRLAYVPRFVGRFDVAYHDDVVVRREHLGISVGAGTTLVGRKPLPFEQLSERIVVLDAGAELRYRFVAVELLIENLLDARYRAYELQAISDFSPVDGSASGSMTASRLFAAGAPRTVFVTLTFRADPNRLTEASP